MTQQEPAGHTGPTPEPRVDEWTDDDSVLSWKLFAGVFVALAVAGILAYTLIGGGDETATGRDGSSASTIGTTQATVRDSFERPDSTTELGAAETGQGWTAETGVWGISDGAAYVSTPNQEGGKRSVAVVDLGGANGSVEATARGMAPGWGLVFRYQGPFNYWMLQAAPQYGTYNLQKVVDGKVVPVTPGGLGFAAVEDGARVRVDFNAATITVSVNGTPLRAVQDVDLAGGTKVGLVVPAAGASTARWDDFAVLLGPGSVVPPGGGGAGAGAGGATGGGLGGGAGGGGGAGAGGANGGGLGGGVGGGGASMGGSGSGAGAGGG